MGDLFLAESAGGERDLRFEFLMEEAAALAGDFNEDGFVDAADYTIWRDNLGTNVVLANETATPGQVTNEDYQTWRTNFGSSSNVQLVIFNGAVKYGTVLAGSGALGAPVPEPTALGLVGLALAIVAGMCVRGPRED
jgi:hypothetical protein